MANPQVEDGHTRIADPVLEALMKAKLTGTQWDLVMAIIRTTWGWEKTEDYISLTQFQKLTGRHRNLIARELTALQTRNIIKQTRKPTIDRAAKWKCNKNWDTWVSPPRVTGITAEGDTSQGDRGITAEGARGITAEVNLQETKRERNKSAGADPRFQPLKKFFHEQYEEIRGTKLDTNISDYKALSDLLKRQPKLSLEYLQQSALIYLKSDKPFHVDQGHPLRFWANNINPFLPGRKQRADDLKELT